MDKKESYKRLILFGMSFVIWIVLVAAWWATWMAYYARTIENPFWNLGNWLFTVVYGIILFFFTSLYGGYKVGDSRRGDVIFSAVFSMVLANGISWLQASLIARKLLPLVPFFYLTVIDFALIWVWATVAHNLYLKFYPPHKVIVVFGGSSLAQTLIVKMSNLTEKYRIQEAVNVDLGREAVLRRIADYQSVLICDVPSELRNSILKYCFEHSIRTYVTPKISDILLRGASSIHLFDTPLLFVRSQPFTFEQRVIKRAIDIACSFLGLIIACPFMLLVALAIKLEDRGPVLFRQTRLTQGGRQFSLYKFRSMVVDAERDSGAVLAGREDSRITAVGRFIRKCRLDELPQLINILNGDMSIVGPRPERPEIAGQYIEQMAEFDYRLKVKAGLTGFAQVLGKYNTTPYDKLKLDLMYISNYSLLLDLKLILMTIKILFVRESTEGV